MDITRRRSNPPPSGGKLRLSSDEKRLRVLDEDGHRARVCVESGTPVHAVRATLSTGLTGSDNDLDFTAVAYGVAGNDITVEYVDPGEETASETVEVVGKAITVTLRSVSSVLSTAAEVKAAIEADGEAAALVTVANKAGNDGSGSVTVLAETALAGGVDATEAAAGDQMFDGSYLYQAVADVAVTSTSGWRKVAHSAL